MDKILKALTGLMLLGVVGFANASYVTVGDGVGSDPVTLVLDSFNPTFVLNANYRIDELKWTVTNTTSNTLNDVKFVLPFVEFNTSHSAYDWDNSSQIWHSNAANGFDLVSDGISAWSSDSSGSPLSNFLLVSNTDIPLSSGSSSVLATDSVPYWDIAATLAAGGSVSFTTYIYQERSSSVDALYVTPYVVAAVPVPTAVWLFGSGLFGLVVIARRKKTA
jgi:hypothetical protein